MAPRILLPLLAYASLAAAQPTVRLLPVYDAEADAYGYVDSTATWRIPARYDTVSPFDELGLAYGYRATAWQLIDIGGHVSVNVPRSLPSGTRAFSGKCAQHVRAGVPIGAYAKTRRSGTEVSLAGTLAGSCTQKVLPRPRALSRVSVPPMRSTSLAQLASPSPVPAYTSSVWRR